MKNLYKKIGALVLAGMVVAGGFAASGAQSFAFSGDYGQLRLALKNEAHISENMEKNKLAMNMPDAGAVGDEVQGTAAEELQEAGKQ